MLCATLPFMFAALLLHSSAKRSWPMFEYNSGLNPQGQKRKLPIKICTSADCVIFMGNFRTYPLVVPQKYQTGVWTPPPEGPPEAVPANHKRQCPQKSSTRKPTTAVVSASAHLTYGHAVIGDRHMLALQTSEPCFYGACVDHASAALEG